MSTFPIGLNCIGQVQVSLEGWSVVFLLAFLFLVLVWWVIINNKKSGTEKIKNSELFQVPIIGFLNEVPTLRLDLNTLFSQSHGDNGLLAFRERIRHLRSHFITQNVDKKVIMITSSLPGEGKSFLLTSLGYSLYMAGKKVLLVDFNLRNNGVTGLFHAKPVLQAGLSAPMQFKDMITQTSVAGIDVIGCSVSHASPLELSSNEALQSLFSSARNEYDFILVEGANLTQFADCRELMPFTDTILCLVADGRILTMFDQLNFQYLSEFERKFAGVVLNKVGLQALELNKPFIQALKVRHSLFSWKL